MREARDEIGAMSAAEQVFRQNLLRDPRPGGRDGAVPGPSAEARRRQATRDLADRFETAIGGIVRAVTRRGAAACRPRLRASPRRRRRRPTGPAGAATAAEEASTNVGTVAAAAEELGSSVDEIGRQVGGIGGSCAGRCGEAAATTGLVQELSTASPADPGGGGH